MTRPPYFAPRALRAALLAGSLVACQLNSPQPEKSEFDPRLEGAMEQLRGAIQAGEDEVAARILSNLRALTPDEVTLEALNRYQDVLDGRAICRRLEVKLKLRSSVERPGELDLLAHVANTGDQRVVLQIPSVELTRTSRALNERGQLLTTASRRFSDALADFAVEAQSAQEALLLSYPAHMTGEILAQDERWTANGRTPFIAVDGRTLPAKALAYTPGEKALLAAFLPASTVEPAAAGEFLAREGVFEREDGRFLPPLLERVVRLRRSDRSAAFESLASRASAWNDEQLSRVIPALRWLTDADVPASRPAAWRQLLADGWPEITDPSSADPVESGRLILPGGNDRP